MHADAAHDKKEGFFSKIFGHHDATAPPTASSAPVVTIPDPSITPHAEASSPATPPAVEHAVTEDQPQEEYTLPSMSTGTPDESGADKSNDDHAEILTGSMSDIHAVPTGTDGPLDLKGDSGETAKDKADDSTQDDSPVIPSIITPSEAAGSVAEPNSASHDSLETDVAHEETELAEDHVAVQAELNASLAEPEPPKSGMMAKTDALTALSNLNGETADQEVVAGPDEPKEPAPEHIPDDATLPVPPLPVPKPHKLEEVEPPAPPMEEGLAWRKEHEDDAEIKDTVKTELVDAEEKKTSGELEKANDHVNAILSEHTEEDMPAEPADKPELDAERRATIVRLQGHIEDLEEQLHTIKNELAKL